MSEINHNIDFENKLAQAAEPEEFEGEKAEPTHDPAKSLHQGLINLYYKYFDQVTKQKEERLINEKNAEEIIARIDALSVKDLGFEVSKYTTIERAKEIMGPEMFFGPEEVKKAGIEIREEIPPIPFNHTDLERAKELGQMLILRTNKTPDGQPLTIQKIVEILQPEFDKEGKGKVLRPMDTYEGAGDTESYFCAETPNFEWALASRNIIPETAGKKYLEQTEILASYLGYQVFAGQTLPSEYSDAISQLHAEKDAIESLLEKEWRWHSEIYKQTGSWNTRPYPLEGSRKLSELKINQYVRHSAVEALYDILIYYQNKRGNIIEFRAAWTRSQAKDGSFVCIESLDPRGILLKKYRFGGDLEIGALFSRRGVDLKL